MIPALAQSLYIVKLPEVGYRLVLSLELVALRHDLLEVWFEHLLFQRDLIAFRAHYFMDQLRAVLPIVKDLKQQVFSSVSALQVQLMEPLLESHLR